MGTRLDHESDIQNVIVTVRRKRPSPGHPVRRRHKAGYVAYPTLDEARADRDAAAVLTGDSGGTIFLTVPLRLVQCDEDALWTLVSDIDAVTWMGGDTFCARVDFEHRPVPATVTGGDGGGKVIDGVWTHRMLPPAIADQAHHVVDGAIARIPSELLRATRDAELRRKRTLREQQAATDERAAAFFSKYPWDFDVRPPTVPFE